MHSSLIRNICYDEARHILSIWFVPSGRRYDYEGVPPDLYAQFLRAFSKGEFFNAHIRNRFPYRKRSDGDE